MESATAVAVDHQAGSLRYRGLLVAGREEILDQLLLGGLYVPSALLCLMLLPGGHPAIPAAAALAVLLFIAVLQLRPGLSTGWFGLQQAVFVLMLFELPLNTVPIVALAATIVAQLIRRRAPVPLAAAADSWYVIPPVLVLAIAAPGPAEWRHWPVYALAFLIQVLISASIQFVRFRIISSGLSLRDALTTLAVDLLLTPVGLAAAVTARGSPAAAATLLIGVGGLLVMLSREHTRSRFHAHQAIRDPLTDLVNRSAFGEALEACVQRTRRGDETGGLVLIDLDDFKQINDTYGHPCGDEVLVAVAKRLRAATRATDLAVRLGGDEFAILLAEPVTAAGVAAAASKLREQLSAPIAVPDGPTCSVGVSIGTATVDGRTPSAVMADADAALYADKRTRKPLDN